MKLVRRHESGWRYTILEKCSEAYHQVNLQVLYMMGDNPLHHNVQGQKLSYPATR